MTSLDLRLFDPGAIIAVDGRRHVLSDPLRDMGSALNSALSPVITPRR